MCGEGDPYFIVLRKIYEKRCQKHCQEILPEMLPENLFLAISLATLLATFFRCQKYCQKCCQKTCFWRYFWQYFTQRFFRALVKQGGDICRKSGDSFSSMICLCTQSFYWVQKLLLICLISLPVYADFLVCGVVASAVPPEEVHVRENLFELLLLCVVVIPVNHNCTTWPEKSHQV